MTTLSDAELLQQYRSEHSETAFAELIRRHLDLVYSAALRQSCGDVQAAEDVTQAVFADLAKQSGRLAAHPSLSGWLYTSTRFLAANQLRTEHRRRKREQFCIQMNHVLQATAPIPDWEQFRPVLDEAMHDLKEADRVAVLERHFERRPYSEVGARLGLTENAARMRVDRALDQLRQALARRGVTSTAAALAVALDGHAVISAPVELSVRVSRAIDGVHFGATNSVGVLARFRAGARRWALSLGIVGAVSLALGIRGLLATTQWRRATPVTGGSELAKARSIPEIKLAAESIDMEQHPPISNAAVSSSGLSSSSPQSSLHLTVLAADTGKPVRRADVELPWAPPGYLGPRKTVTDDAGVVTLPFPTEAKELRVVVSAEGYAATMVHWVPARGLPIPPDYSVRLGAAVVMGGTVLNSQGKPVPGAVVNWGHADSMGQRDTVESHDFVNLSTQTDGSGRWQLHRIAADMFSKLTGQASHTNYVDSPVMVVNDVPVGVSNLLGRTHIFQLGQGIDVLGQVLSSAGQPINAAKVRVGAVGLNTGRDATTDATGWFQAKGCVAGVQPVSAAADGFATATLEVEVTANGKPLVLELFPGRTIHFQVVDPRGSPISKATIHYDTLGNVTVDPSGTESKPIQAEFTTRTDAEGWATWMNAPPGSLGFNVMAKEFFRRDDVTVASEDRETRIVLNPALIVSGQVNDATTGTALQRFRMTAGYPRKARFGTNTEIVWNTSDRYSVVFAGGQYRHAFENALTHGVPNPGYLLRFSADGYGPYVSRLINPDEGELHLDVQIRPDAGITVTVLTSTGEPAANAEVALLETGQHVHLTASREGFGKNYSDIGLFQVASAEGRVHLNGVESLRRIAFVHKLGYLDLSPADLSSNTVVTLRAWGQILGTMPSAAEPGPAQGVQLEMPHGYTGVLSLDFNSSRAVADKDGRFSFSQIPPGTFRLTRLFRMEPPIDRIDWRSGASREIVVSPDRITDAALGTQGSRVTARIVWPPGINRPAGGILFAGLNVPRPEPPLAIRANAQAMGVWAQSDEIKAYSRKTLNYPLVLQPDGTFLAEEVEAGTYSFDAAMVISAQPSQPLAQGRRMVVIPEPSETRSIDLGELILEAGR